MAAQTLSVFTHPGFSQVLTSLIAHEIRRVDQLLYGCAFEDYRGRFDAKPCTRPATVHHLGHEVDYCLKHFEAVERG